jgi:hypothetical protein
VNAEVGATGRYSGQDTGLAARWKMRGCNYRHRHRPGYSWKSESAGKAAMTKCSSGGDLDEVHARPSADRGSSYCGDKVGYLPPR